MSKISKIFLGKFFEMSSNSKNCFALKLSWFNLKKSRNWFSLPYLKSFLMSEGAAMLESILEGSKRRFSHTSELKHEILFSLINFRVPSINLDEFVIFIYHCLFCVVTSFNKALNMFKNYVVIIFSGSWRKPF